MFVCEAKWTSKREGVKERARERERIQAITRMGVRPTYRERKKREREREEEKRGREREKERETEKKRVRERKK